MSTSKWIARSGKVLWAGALVLILMLTVPHFMTTTRGIYKLAVTMAHQSQKFSDVLGSPVSEAWFSEGTWQSGDSGRGEILIPVQGRMREETCGHKPAKMEDACD
jgi:hypothetical protein